MQQKDFIPMKTYGQFKAVGLSFLIVMVCCCFGLTSSIAQEQMTFFKGDPCCYYVDDLFTYGERVYVVARDHQKSVKIYGLEEADTLLLLSTHHVDKTYLLDQGRREDFYYWVYTDRLEIFFFDAAVLQLYEFPQPLEEELRDKSGAFTMSPHGLVIVPAENDSITRFYNLSTGRMDTIKNTMSRNIYRIAIDSFIYFTTSQNDNIALLSHNIVTDELSKIYTAGSLDFRFSPYGNVLYFKDDLQVYISKGRKANTRFLFSLRADHNRVKIERADSTISFLTYGSGQDIYFAQYDVDEFALLDEKEFTHRGSDISNFKLSQENDIVFLSLSSHLYYYDRSMDSLILIEDLGHRNYGLNEGRIYYFKESELFTFDLESGVKSIISSPQSYSGILRFQNSGDSLFYLSSRTNEGKYLISLYDRELDSLLALIQFGEHTGGNAFVNPVRKGSHLFVTDQNLVPKQVLISDKFVNISAITPSSPPVEWNGRVYMIGRDKNLYELDDNFQFHLRIERLPVKNANNTLFLKSNQLYTYKGNALIQLRIDQGNYREIRPTTQYDDLRFLPDTNARYLLHAVDKDGQSTELWRYDIILENWLKLADDLASLMSVELPDHSLIIGNHLLCLLKTAEGIQLRSVNLLDAENIALTDFNMPSMDGVAFFFASYARELLIYYHSSDQQISEIWRTDGSLEGTAMLDNMDDREGYVIPYQFEGKLYFTKLDSFFTTTFIYEGGGELNEVDWTPFLISQRQYRLEDKVYVLGNRLYPRQNLTLAELYGGQLLELIRSPYELGFSASRHDGTINNEVPTLRVGDSLLVIVGNFDPAGEEMWFLHSDQRMERRTDLNEGLFDAFISGLTVHNGYLYFKGYRYGPGHQIWRIPISDNLSFVQNGPSPSQPLELFPNPAHDKLNMLNLPVEQGVIIIYDQSGRKLKRIVKPKGYREYALSISGLLNGMYFIQLKCDDKYFSTRFLKVE